MEMYGLAREVEGLSDSLTATGGSCGQTRKTDIYGRVQARGSPADRNEWPDDSFRQGDKPMRFRLIDANRAELPVNGQ